MKNPLFGTWKLNVEKSTADPGPLVRSEIRTYEAIGEDGLKLFVQGIGAIGAAYSYSATGKLDGEDYPLTGSGTRNDADSASWLRIDSNTTESVVKQTGKVVNLVRFEVSQDGTMLKLHESGTSPGGAATRGIRVYDRQRFPVMSDAAADFWRRYLLTLPAGHPHRRAKLDAFSFGDSPVLADELAALVVAGAKRATTSLAVEFTSLGQPLPSAGDASVVMRGDGVPAAVIEVVEVRQVPFKDVDESFAAEEGEGDCTLAWWRSAHRRYFSRVAARLGGGFDDATPVICQRFRLAWRG